MKEQDENKKRLILFGGTAALMLILLCFWIFNFNFFLSSSDQKAVKDGDGLGFSDIKNKFNNSFAELKNSLDDLSEKSEAANKKEASAQDLKKFADSLEANIVSSSARDMALATSSSSTDFTVENVSSSSASSSIEVSDETTNEIKTRIEEINKRIQSNKE